MGNSAAFLLKLNPTPEDEVAAVVVDAIVVATGPVTLASAETDLSSSGSLAIAPPKLKAGLATAPLAVVVVGAGLENEKLATVVVGAGLGNEKVGTVVVTAGLANEKVGTVVVTTGLTLATVAVVESLDSKFKVEDGVTTGCAGLLGAAVDVWPAPSPKLVVGAAALTKLFASVDVISLVLLSVDMGLENIDMDAEDVEAVGTGGDTSTLGLELSMFVKLKLTLLTLGSVA